MWWRLGTLNPFARGKAALLPDRAQRSTRDGSTGAAVIRCLSVLPSAFYSLARGTIGWPVPTWSQITASGTHICMPQLTSCVLTTVTKRQHPWSGTLTQGFLQRV